MANEVPPAMSGVELIYTYSRALRSQESSKREMVNVPKNKNLEPSIGNQSSRNGSIDNPH